MNPPAINHGRLDDHGDARSDAHPSFLMMKGSLPVGSAKDLNKNIGDLMAIGQ
jgi:hypothetical protein